MIFQVPIANDIFDVVEQTQKQADNIDHTCTLFKPRVTMTFEPWSHDRQMAALTDAAYRYCIVAFPPSQISPRKTGYIVAFPPENWLYSSLSPGEILLYSQISPFL